MSLLDPLSHALAGVVATTHSVVTSLGGDPDAAGTWLLAIAGVVVLVRLALLPLVVRGVRQAHATARARPHLKQLTEQYRERLERRDPDAVRAFVEERRRVGAEHGVSRLGCLPTLALVPIWMALYHLLARVADGTAVGALTPALVASFGSASLLGVPLAAHGYDGSGLHVAVVAGLAGAAAVISFVTQRFLVAPTTPTDGMPEAMLTAQRVTPVLSAGGLLLAGGVVPVALLAYWVLSGLWTCGQAAVVWRWFPTPGSAAAARRAAVGGFTT
ncbi:YidC/Oxa1 family membrane protein insertase [Nocardioides sp. J9]|uniref:membrane protein insertase YidC n=1 Tax=Nocardioides sp. J9 TaxID=935844 RepID=UPI0011AA29DA|nr:membrane protein insertase YidC [Nocardioides sp. J9]TWG98151.1 YidC/Oxa1 family membrane protein insertase [Nocardioides sp. J9]